MDTATLTINDVESLNQDAALAYVNELGIKAADVKALVLNNVAPSMPQTGQSVLMDSSLHLLSQVHTGS